MILVWPQFLSLLLLLHRSASSPIAQKGRPAAYAAAAVAAGLPLLARHVAGLPAAAPAAVMLPHRAAYSGQLAMVPNEAAVHSALVKRTLRTRAALPPPDNFGSSRGPHDFPSPSQPGYSPSIFDFSHTLRSAWAKAKQKLLPARPRYQDYSPEELNQLNDFIDRILDPELQKCVMFQAYAWSRQWPASRVTLTRAEVDSEAVAAAPSAPPNIVGVLSALMRRCDAHMKRLATSGSKTSTLLRPSTAPDSRGGGGGSNGVHADWIDDWADALYPLGETISAEHVRRAREQLNDEWAAQQDDDSSGGGGAGGTPLPPPSTEFSIPDAAEVLGGGVESRAIGGHSPGGAGNGAKSPVKAAVRYLGDLADLATWQFRQNAGGSKDGSVRAVRHGGSGRRT